jgi:glycosyltransferase involved in cell wall biosynthesis
MLARLAQLVRMQCESAAAIKKMRILFFNWEYPPQGSGIGRYNELLTTALRRSGHFCLIATSMAPGCPEFEQLDNGIVCRLCAKEDMGRPETARQVLKLAKEHKIDLIEGADHLGHCAALLREKVRPPVCVKLHYNDVLHDLRYAQAAYRWQIPLIWLACLRQRRRLAAERFSMENADFVTAPCQAILRRAGQQGLGLPPRTGLLANPVAMPLSLQGAESEQPTLLLVGRIDFGKGIQFLPQIMTAVRRQLPEAVLELAGADSPAKGIGSLLRWLTDRTDSDAVRYLGLLNREELNKAYQRAWLVLSPSKWDTFPNTVLEAMAHGKTVAASPFGGAQEMLAGTENLVARPDSSGFVQGICRLLADKELRQRAGAQGRSKAEQDYAPSRLAQNYIHWFAQQL